MACYTVKFSFFTPVNMRFMIVKGYEAVKPRKWVPVFRYKLLSASSEYYCALKVTPKRRQTSNTLSGTTPQKMLL